MTFIIINTIVSITVTTDFSVLLKTPCPNSTEYGSRTEALHLNVRRAKFKALWSHIRVETVSFNHIKSMCAKF